MRVHAAPTEDGNHHPLQPREVLSMDRPFARTVRALSALAAGGALLAACEGIQPVAPAPGPSPRYAESIAWCNQTSPPSDLGMTNTAIVAVWIAGCENATMHSRNLLNGSVSVVNYSSSQPNTFAMWYAPEGQQDVCMSPTWDFSRLTCFSGPKSGELVLIRIYTYSAPPKPPDQCTITQMFGQSFMTCRSGVVPRFRVRSRTAVIGVRG